MSARRRMPDPDAFYRLTRTNGCMHSVSREALGSGLPVLGTALDRWLYAARSAYAACDPETVRHCLRNARAVYGELTTRADMTELGPWT